MQTNIENWKWSPYGFMPIHLKQPRTTQHSQPQPAPVANVTEEYQQIINTEGLLDNALTSLANTVIVQYAPSFCSTISQEARGYLNSTPMSGGYASARSLLLQAVNHMDAYCHSITQTGAGSLDVDAYNLARTDVAAAEQIVPPPY